MKKEIRINSRWQNIQTGEAVVVLSYKVGLVEFRRPDFSKLIVADSRFVKLYKEVSV